MKQKIADKLNGRMIDYPPEIPADIENEAASNNCIIIYGNSDDLVEVRGASKDEIGAYGGVEIYFNNGGLVGNLCHDDDCPYHEKEKECASKVEALFDDEDGDFAWTFKTDIPHATFTTYEDGIPFGQGIVIDKREC